MVESVITPCTVISKGLYEVIRRAADLGTLSLYSMVVELRQRLSLLTRLRSSFMVAHIGFWVWGIIGVPHVRLVNWHMTDDYFLYFDKVNEITILRR